MAKTTLPLVPFRSSARSGVIAPQPPVRRSSLLLAASAARSFQESIVDPSIEAGALPPGTQASVRPNQRGGYQLGSYFVPDPILGGKFVTSAGGARVRKQQLNEERLRFLREQTRRGRLSSVLVGQQASAGGGFQLGRKSVLGA